MTMMQRFPRLRPYFLAASCRVWLDTTMVKARLVFSCLLLLLCALPLRAFTWGTATYNGREYVTLQSFCYFYGFGYQSPAGNNFFRSQNGAHSIGLKLGASDMYLDGVHYVMSFPVESGDHDWLISRMDVIKLFEPILRPTEISGRHAIRGVVIDAGHGGSDNGAVSARGGMEKNYTIDTAFRLESILRGAGLKTVLTRRNDVFVDLYERAHIASLYPDYCFVSIHYNSATPEARGLETYCLSPRGAASSSSAYLTRADIYKLPGNDEDAQNILLASMVHSEIIRLNPGDQTSDRGVKRARFVVIKQNTLPAILVEGGFVSNRMEAARVNQPDYRQRLAEAIARGVLRFANVMGNRHLEAPASMPGEEAEAGAPPPRALPVVPAAPSGLAHEAGVKMSVQPASFPAPGKTPVTKTSNHKSKKKKVASSSTSATPPAAAKTTTPAPAAASTSPPPVNEKSGTKPAAPLNLADPAPPPATAAPEKAGAEPDEPPTVNIYSGGQAKPPEKEPSTETAPAPASSPAASPPSAPASTNAASGAPAEP
jgi:N-acetylmuramoyl-L-alanine amidase